MKEVAWYLKRPDGKYVSFDSASGGYPYESDTLEKNGIFFMREDAEGRIAFWNGQPSYKFTGLTLHTLYADE